MSAPKRYNFARALLSHDFPKFRDHEYERSRDLSQAARANGMDVEGVQIDIRAGIDTGATTGGTFKLVKPGSFIELLRNLLVCGRAGATFIDGLTGPQTLPKQISAGTGSWIGENPGSDTSDSNLTTSTVSLAFKTLMSTTSVSRQALFSAASGNYDLEAIIRQDLAAVIALAIDLAAINGLGSANQPLGLMQNTAVPGATVASDSGNGGTYALADHAAIESTLALANADEGSLGIVTTPAVRKKLRATFKNGTGSGALWKNGAIVDTPAFVSNQIPANLTRGTSTTVCSALIFGAWSQLLIGRFTDSLSFIVDPYTKKKAGMVEITMAAHVDVAVRHPESFVVLKDVLTT